MSTYTDQTERYRQEWKTPVKSPPTTNDLQIAHCIQQWKPKEEEKHEIPEEIKKENRHEEGKAEDSHGESFRD